MACVAPSLGRPRRGAQQNGLRSRAPIMVSSVQEQPVATQSGAKAPNDAKAPSGAKPPKFVRWGRVRRYTEADLLAWIAGRLGLTPTAA